MFVRFKWSVIVFCFVLDLVARAQVSAPPVTTPTPPKVPLGATMSGSLSQTTGQKTETGTVTLTVNADGSTAEMWTLPASTRTFKQASFSDGRTCQWTDASGTIFQPSSVRCFRPVPWFAPWTAAKTVTDGVTTAVDDTTDALKSAGQSRQVYKVVLPAPKDPKSHAIPGLTRLTNESAIEVTYDSTTSLPSRVDYQDIPDTEPLKTVSTYVLFSDYREESGFLLPHHIQRYLQGTLLADIQINSVSIQ